MARELKKYGLRSTRKPTLNPRLSSTVCVIDEQGLPGYCYIAFEEALVDAVGLKLPRGVAEFDPAFLQVEWNAKRGRWIITAKYLNTEGYAVLWESESKPTWLNVIRYEGKNGSREKNAKRSGRRRAAAAGPQQDRTPRSRKAGDRDAAGVAIA